MKLIQCAVCNQHYKRTDNHCPHCDGVVAHQRTNRTALALLLGLGMVGCGGGKETPTDTHAQTDTQTDTNSDINIGETAQPGCEPPYGVPADADGDGYGMEEDCDDDDPFAHPYAAENEENPHLCMVDADGDGYGSDSPNNPDVTPGTDRDDGDPDVH